MPWRCQAMKDAVLRSRAANTLGPGISEWEVPAGLTPVICAEQVIKAIPAELKHLSAEEKRC